MDGRIPCVACGTPVLPMTAQRNQGRCAPCAKGTRTSIEESKRRIEAERSQAPEPNYWLPLADKNFKEGFHALSAAERVYFCAGLLDREVHNGGFEQYFTNSSGMHYYETEASLAELGLDECLGLLREAKQALFGGAQVAADRKARTDEMLLTVRTQAVERKLDELNSRFTEAFPRSVHRIDEFALRNRLPFVLT